MRRLSSTLALLALAACLPAHVDPDLDPTDRDGSADVDVDVDIPDGGEGLTVDPVTGAVASAGDGAGRAEAPATPDGTFRWDDRAGALALGDTLRDGKVRTSDAGGWTTRTLSGGGYGGGPAGGAVREEGGILRRGGGGRDHAGAAPMAAPMAAPLPEMEMAVAADEGGYGGGRVAPAQQGLKAGSTDDNADLDAFARYVAEWTGKPGVAGQVDTLDVSDVRTIRVTDATGRPIPAARVSVVDNATDELVWTGKTYGDGTAPFYPHLRAGLLGEAGGDGAAGYSVQVSHGGTWTVAQLPRRGDDLAVTLDAEPEGAVQLDVVFLIDTTGSMGDEIDRIKSTLLSTTERLRGLDQDFDLQYGAVLYRDIGDEYVTKAHPLTGDIRRFDRALQGIQAMGGGDGPESLNQGLAVAIDHMDWRTDAAKLVFVVADAPPHMDYQQDVSYGRSALAALHHGIRIHTVAASGLDDRGSLVFRQTAQLGQGRFIYIEYGSAAASAADHGVARPGPSNNLDDILYREIRDELVNWGRPGAVAKR